MHLFSDCDLFDVVADYGVLLERTRVSVPILHLVFLLLYKCCIYSLFVIIQILHLLALIFMRLVYMIVISL